MRAMATWLAVVLSTAAAGAAALIVLPAPTKALALAAIVASEKSVLIAAVAAVALPLALFDLRSKPGVAATLLALFALGASALPIVQARALARARGVSLDFARYLRAPIDGEGPGQPDKTVPYATVDGRTLSLDVYLPKPSASLSRPLLVVHGGYWSAGARGNAPLGSRRLADLGFTVFDVEYRISPQPNWKTAVGDVKCAIGWVKRHATTPDWVVDPRKVALLGRSAGGHLVLLAAYTPADRELPASCEAGDTSVEAVIGLYAPTDLVWGYANPSNPFVADSPAKLRAFLGGAPEAVGDRYRALSPTERVAPSAPRTFLAQGGRDQFLQPANMERLASRLVATGVPHDTLFIPYAQHGFDYVVGGLSSQILEAAVLEFLRPPG